MTISPREPSHVESLSYSARGEVKTSRDDLREDIETTLNLNDEALCARRREAVIRMADALGRKTGKEFSPKDLREALGRCSSPDERGYLVPFAGALAWWLRRRLGER